MRQRGIRGRAPKLAFAIDYVSDYLYAGAQWQQ